MILITFYNEHQSKYYEIVIHENGYNIANEKGEACLNVSQNKIFKYIDKFF